MTRSIVVETLFIGSSWTVTRKFLPMNKIEFRGPELVGAVQVVHRVDDHENVVFVIVDLRALADRDAVFDGEGMEIEHAFEKDLVLLVGGVLGVDPDLHALVIEHEPQDIHADVLADQLALAEYERANHERLFNRTCGPRKGANEVLMEKAA